MTPQPSRLLSQVQKAEATLAIEALVRVTLTQAVNSAADDEAQRYELAGGVAALLLRRYVQQASHPEDYLERVMRVILTP